jgi:hypothetical protein
MATNGLSLPAAVTGPGSRRAEIARQMTRRGVPDDMREQIATALKSGLLPQHVRTPEQAITIALKGRELGLPMMQSFASIFVVNGLPSCAASLMLGLAYRRLPAFDLVVSERTTKRCALKARRSPQHSWVEAAYTIEEAQTAGLTSKDNWKRNPAAMLAARATAALLRLVAPDTFSGLYATEEAEDAAPVEEAVQPVDVTVLPVADPTPEAPALPPSIDRNALLRDLVAEEIRGDMKRAAERIGLVLKTSGDLKALPDERLQALHAETFRGLGDAAPDPISDETAL